MPKIVDREQRREEILDAYLRLVLREGIAAATTRALARECGMAGGGLWSYFESFEKLRIAAFERTFPPAKKLLLDETPENRGLVGLSNALKIVLPLDDESFSRAQLSMIFLESEQRGEMYEVQAQMETVWKKLFLRRLQEAQQDQQIQLNAKLEDLADMLLSLAVGLQMEYALGTSRGAPQRQWEIIECCLSPWLVGDLKLAG